MSVLEVEHRIRALCDAAAWADAVTLMLESHGPEVLSYIRVIAAPARVDAAFSDFAFDLWQGLPTFRWACTVRGFAFTLARHAVERGRVSAARTERRERRWAEERWLLDAIARTRSHTPNFQITEVKERVRELRQELSEDERTLLSLRLDRGLSFRDLAAVMGHEGELHDVERARRVVARLRKRYQAVKDKLRARMEAEGLVQPRSG